MTEKELIEVIERAARDGRTELDLSNRGIESLPPEIGKLTKLTVLDLSYNQLTSLPPELEKITKLTELHLSGNQLSSIPKGIGKLANLKLLYLSNNQLTSLPPEIGELANLRALDLVSNELTSVPKELSHLKNLTKLNIRLNPLTSIPNELGQLRNLKRLDLAVAKLTTIPKELCRLTNLTELDLCGNRLTNIPKELSQLKNLKRLTLIGNRLTSVPKELGRLTNLLELDLKNNELTIVPKELGRLKSLKRLDLGRNELTIVPKELGQLKNVIVLWVDRNPLESPPPEVVEQGITAVLAYLRERLKAAKRQWVSKLLVVGEGGVGKTSLVRALREEPFIEGLETTHGIGVKELELVHPKEAGVAMQLNTWDFGGQQIYHATHQFFLTNRALFVLVWDARHGWEAGKLYNWLDRIQARAPESPVLVVAAHIDEREADLPLDDLRKKYPQIRGHYKVSNKQGTGIEEFRDKLAEVAADLPLMGEEWPAAWVDSAEGIRKLEEGHISPKRLFDLMGEHEVTGESADVLAQWLHELGDILYFREDEELNDTVILKPVWVTEAISKVLESDEVTANNGILTREHRDRLWRHIDESIRDHFLRLMERFDLSYRTLENREISLVVERLPLNPPDYQGQWDAIKEKEGCKEISMNFALSSLQAGIPTWFIARSHRFTTHTHWRMGALFADGTERRHLGLIEAYPHDRYLRLTVRGPVPQNFFVLLRDGLELTLTRFPGLKIKRTIPCPGHAGRECEHEFEFVHLIDAVSDKEPVLEFQCPKSRRFVSVTKLLYGLDILTQNEVIKRIDALHAAVVAGDERIFTELRELRKLTQREFLRLFNAEQRLAESHCPNVFAVLPKDGRGWLKNILGQKIFLQLYCQAPGEWHPTKEGGRYEIPQPAEWLRSIGPYIVKLAKVIKYAAPVAGAAADLYAGGIAAVMGKEFAGRLPKQIKLMEELAKKIGDEKDFLRPDWVEGHGREREAERVEGAALRGLRQLLDEVDPAQNWGGLKKILTPEGHYLWLCEGHATEYKK